ncbi:hypothetical protein GTO27_09275 [Candidatus Bathyarchaeota archaeon]|nr:hypothetical protein [Candidatus Bathyarchaeota archaeon]
MSIIAYPVILLASWFYKEKVSVGEVLGYIWKARTARGLNTQMIEESKIVVFAPNIISAFIAVLAKYFDFLQISKEAIIALLISHFCLIVLTTIGTAFLRMALNRLLIIFIGEILMEWALIGGSLLFTFQIFEFRRIVGVALSSLLISAIAFFLVCYIWFRMKESAQIYADLVIGARTPGGTIAQDKFIVKVASNLEEAQELAKDDYEKVDEFDDRHIYRKPNKRT